MTTRQPVLSFLSFTGTMASIDRIRLAEIRTLHPIGISDDQTLKTLAKQLNLLDDSTNIAYLRCCLRNSSIEGACVDICTQYTDEQCYKSRPQRQSNIVSAHTSPPFLETTMINTILPASSEASSVEIVSEAMCSIHLKQDRPQAVQFINEFLLRSLAHSETIEDSIRRIRLSPPVVTSTSSSPLTRNCVLDIFIRHRLAECDVIELGRQMRKIRLVDPAHVEDEFSVWDFDRLRGVFDLWLVPASPIEKFPLKWKLASNARLFYCLQTDVNVNSSCNEDQIRNVDRPSTISLERFVQDVCDNQNNGNYQKWIVALRENDIVTYSHLSSLKHSEWSELKMLSVNARKILKSAVDQEKQLADELKKMSDHSGNGSSVSVSQLLASLHQIRLYFHHILQNDFVNAHISNPAKLDRRCVSMAFDEMRQDGFADDGLFDKMKIFFLPLTIVEKDIDINDNRWAQLFSNLNEEKKGLSSTRKDFLKELEILEDQYYNLDDLITKMERQNRPRNTHDATASAASMSPITPSTMMSKNVWEQLSIQQQIDDFRETQKALEPRRRELRSAIHKIDDMLFNVTRALEDRKNQGSNRDLIKPNRGFIMYGPPGTGKSDIMSKISERMGISMVAPPLSAGELNRSLVGESERIINDICMRCHRIPYLMCCISIDEIDSLAPKRTDDSSESNVAKLSVLLSVIDGIKDVPNLMIFCATNRLHMMDEAFLRRMQGKFFVGRPSSQARKEILSKIKTWHMSRELLENLTMATTNFSGAALRALRRSITVHCIDAGRDSTDYQITYQNALELANDTAQQYRIFIGGETLPTLLIRNLKKNQSASVGILPEKRNSVYTGRILINLSARRIDVEAIQIHSDTQEREKIVYQDTLADHETDMQQLLERLTNYGKSRNVQLLQLIDLSLLNSESAYDEKRKFEILTERVDECLSYRRSMVIFDLDSLIGVNISEGQSSTGRSTNISLNNQNVYTFVGDRFQKAHVDEASNDEEKLPAKENWAVVVVRDPFLVRQFCDFIQFTRTPREMDEEEEERRRQQEQILCIKCNDYYIELDNRMGACVHHDGFIYDNSSLRLERCDQHTAIEQLLKEEALMMNESTQKERLEKMKQRFKFICCNQTLQINGNVGGCKKTKHGVQRSEETRNNEHPVTVDEWKAICDNNLAYQEKRIRLLQSRSMTLSATRTTASGRANIKSRSDNVKTSDESFSSC